MSSLSVNNSTDYLFNIQTVQSGAFRVLVEALKDNCHYSLAVDGRFKGGYITRNYGVPSENIHTFQLELSIATYMNEEPAMFWQEALAEKVRPTLKLMLESALKWGSK